MKQIFAWILLAGVFSLQAAAPPRGDDRLRELVVFPRISLDFNWGIHEENDEWVITRSVDLSGEIARQRTFLKQHPDDLKSLMRLGYLLASNDETNDANVVYQKAAQLCRAKIAISPQAGLNWLSLARALPMAEADEAEPDYRKAVLLSSNEWRCWIGLGNFLEDQAFGSIFSRDVRNMVTPGQAPSSEVLSYHPSPEVLEKSVALNTEASRCFTQAIALAPKEPEVYFQRAGFMSHSNLFNCYLRYYRDHEKIDKSEWALAMFSPGTVANLKLAAALTPKDYEDTSLAAYFEVYPSVLRLMSRSSQSPFALDMLPDNTRQSVHQAMTHLENLSEDPDQKIAAGALENLAMLQMMFGNDQATVADARRSLALDPTREQSWNLLLIKLATAPSPDYSEIAAVCRTRLKANDSAFNHVLLSKMYVMMKKWREAQEQLEIAARQETNNILPPLVCAAIALRQSSETNNLPVALTNLMRAASLIGNMAPGEEKTGRVREFMLNSAIYFALNGDPETARDWLNNILGHLPDDADAREILNALN